jgi:hypothetical protein
MININYQKRKNQELFKSLENPKTLFLSNSQNYIPIYNKFFALNDTNFNNINFNHKWYLTNVKECEDDEDLNGNIFYCNVKNIATNKSKEKEVFFKMAPLLDPFKYLVGKYDIEDKRNYSLPQLNSTVDNCNSKFIDQNNSAYVDGLFLFLSSNLIYEQNFLHGVDYYGSFLGIKNNFIVNAFDDIDYLNNSEFFNKNKGVLFKIDDYEHLFQEEENCKLKPITIGNDVLNFSIKSFDNKQFEDIFEEGSIDLNHLKDMSIDLVDMTNSNLLENNDSKNVSLKSNSSCSSRTSYTEENNEDVDNEDVDNEDVDNEDVDNKDVDNEDIDDKSTVWEDQDEEDDISSFEEERINVTIPKFPIQLICMENCDDTFDNLILEEDLTKEEWFSTLMQIIMILLTYQKAFNFTHNDLHTNNVMYNKTDKKFIYYCYKKKYYKVPTFGRIFKIIDFGRSIYKFDGKLFCSDSFQAGGDAATQYNTEPYLNEKKPRLEPNFSFDLCRLACSIFDYVVEDFDEIKDLSKCNDPVKKLIVEWCLDDKGLNMLYKGNGVDRYPDFKLYKMIARCVHNHTPQAQLERPEFSIYSDFKGDLPNGEVIDIDKIPVCI